MLWHCDPEFGAGSLWRHHLVIHLMTSGSNGIRRVYSSFTNKIVMECLDLAKRNSTRLSAS
jgi:hypothetical protein